MDEDKEIIKKFLQTKCLGKSNAKGLNKLLLLNNETARVVINNFKKERIPICSEKMESNEQNQDKN